MAKQKINDGISLTQGEIKKNEEIDWNSNPKLNSVTKQCINFMKKNLTFEEYLEERRQKDPKFVDVTEDQQYTNSQNNEDQNEGENVSEFSLSDEDLSTKGNSFISKLH
jgi:hypothetical protein